MPSFGPLSNGPLSSLPGAYGQLGKTLDSVTSAATGVSPVTGILGIPTTPSDVLGARLYVEFSSGYSGGLLTDHVNGEQAGQTTSGDRPAAAVTPGGSACLTFDSSDSLHGDDALCADVRWQTLLDLPAVGTAQRLCYFVFKCTHTTEGDYQPLLNFQSTSISIRAYGGCLSVDDATGGYQEFRSNSDVRDSAWHRVIIWGDDATATTKMILDGVEQTASGSFAFGKPSEWGTYGPDVGGGFVGSLGQIGFAYTATTWAAGDFADLDAALLGVIEGGASYELGALTVSATGVSPVVGLLSSTLGAAALSATGEAATSAVGELSATLADVAISSSGVSPVIGSASQALDVLTLASAGVSTIVGSVAAVLDAATSAAAGTSTVVGISNSTLEGVALSAASSAPVVGDLGVTLEAAAASVTGTSPIVGALDAPLADVSLSATGADTSDNTGALAVTLEDASIASAGVSPVVGALSGALSDVTISGAGESPITGALSGALSACTLSGTASAPVVASAANTLASILLEAVGAAPVTGSVAVDLDGLGILAQSLPPRFGALDQALDSLSATAAAVAPVVGVLSGALDVLTGAGESQAPARGMLSATLDGASLAADALLVGIADIRLRQSVLTDVVARNYLATTLRLKATPAATLRVVQSNPVHVTALSEPERFIGITQTPATRVNIMANASTYNVDDTAQITVTFLVSGILTDPTAVFAEVKRLTPTPAGATVTYEYGVDPELVKVSTGIYRLDFDCDTAGTYAVHVRSTGPAKGGEDTTFTVTAKST